MALPSRQGFKGGKGQKEYRKGDGPKPEWNGSPRPHKEGGGRKKRRCESSKPAVMRVWGIIRTEDNLDDAERNH